MAIAARKNWLEAQYFLPGTRVSVINRDSWVGTVVSVDEFRNLWLGRYGEPCGFSQKGDELGWVHVWCDKDVGIEDGYSPNSLRIVARAKKIDL